MPQPAVHPSPDGPWPAASDLDFIASAAHPARLHRLPMPGSGPLRVRLVDETRQRAGSFKFRGAALAVRNAAAGIVACGSGNFPNAIGEAAVRSGCPALVVMPEDAPDTKRRMAQQSGAAVRFVPRPVFTQVAAEEAEKKGWRLAHPYQSPEMLAGGCSLGLEIAAAIGAAGTPEDAVVVACGGGGLAAGTVLGLRMRGVVNPVYVVEPASHPRLAAAMRAGHPTEIAPSGQTICDALRATRLGDLAFDILTRFPVLPTTAADDEVGAAAALLLEAGGVRAELSGAIALAAVLGGRIPERHGQAWVVVCGGNI